MSGAVQDRPHSALRTPIRKTEAEHREFLCEYVRLQLWFLWTWLRRHPEESFTHAIRNRVDILRKSDINPGRSKVTRTPGDFADPRWIALEQEAHWLYLRTADASADAFEREAWKIFRPVVEARVERDFAEGDGLEHYQCGSLSYHPPKPLCGSYVLSAAVRRLLHSRPPVVSFHVGNRIAPKSIFADRGYLPGCFLQLMDETRTKYRAGILSTRTWLNSYPRWLELFPEEWLVNRSPPCEDVDWSQASWGQFINSRGTLNRAHASLLRQSGSLPYKARRSWCTFASMQDHLRRYLAP